MNYVKQSLCVGVAIASLFALLITNNAHAQNTQNFQINSLNAVYELSRNDNDQSNLKVNEFFNVQFPDYDQNHGILRALPLTYNDTNLNLKVTRVDAAADEQTQSIGIWPYSTSKDNGNLVLKIGDPNVYVRGQQNYRIAYEMTNVTRNFDGYDELFWDVNGTDWQQTFLSTKATVLLKTDIAARLTNSKCFTGMQGSTSSDCQISISDNKERIDIIANRPLGAGENLSFVLAFEPGTFAAPPVDYAKKFAPVIAAVLLLVPILGAAIFMTRSWRKSGRDAAGRGTIVPQYQQPENVTVLLSAFVLKESFNTSALPAQVIDLAIRGIVKIIDSGEEGKPIFSIEYIGGVEGLTAEEQSVLEIIFGSKSPASTQTITLKELEPKPKLQQALGNQIEQTATSRGLFVTKPSKIKNKYALLGSGLLVIGFLCLIVSPLRALGIGCIGAGAIILIFSSKMPARTQAGVELKEYLLGLKEYIKLAEADRINFHHSPAGAERKKIDTNDSAQMIKLFEELLPYAMLFGLEKQWSKQFATLYTVAPAWFAGTGSTFNNSAFIGGIGGFSSASSQSFSPPSSSSGSGFSGGGFSGGGGGGGGGGGW